MRSQGLFRSGGSSIVRLAIAVIFLVEWAAVGAGHGHINAGARESRPGEPLYFVNGDQFEAESGYVLAFTEAQDGVHAGLFRGSVSFTALASTPDYGGPAFDHAAAGAHLELVVESLSGPQGGVFGFWENEEGEEGESVTFEVATGTDGGTNRFHLSETAGLPGDDPYGHVHGRVFTVSRPGFYVAGFRIIDTSSNGPDGGPLHPPSELFRLNFQAGVTIATIELDESEAVISFAALAGGAYQVERADSLDPEAVWRPVGDPVEGDNHLKVIRAPLESERAFFRLRRQ